MLRNTSLTIYHRESNVSGEDNWIRIPIENAWWFKNSNSTISNQGQSLEDTFTVRIQDTDLLIEIGDIVAKGILDLEITTIKDLKGYDFFKVMGINVNKFGATPHTKIVGR